MKVYPGCHVTIEFELRAKGGKVIEATEGRGLAYIHGDGRMLPALEKRIEGMEIGEERRGEIAAAEAFGAEDGWPTKELLRREFPEGAELAVDNVFQARGPAGQPIAFKILEVGAERVRVRLMPPLAGVDLEYRVKVLLIDDPKRRKRATLVPLPPPDALGIKAEDDK